MRPRKPQLSSIASVVLVASTPIVLSILCWYVGRCFGQRRLRGPLRKASTTSPVGPCTCHWSLFSMGGPPESQPISLSTIPHTSTGLYRKKYECGRVGFRYFEARGCRATVGFRLRSTSSPSLPARLQFGSALSRIPMACCVFVPGWGRQYSRSPASWFHRVPPDCTGSAFRLWCPTPGAWESGAVRPALLGRPKSERARCRIHHTPQLGPNQQRWTANLFPARTQAPAGHSLAA